MLRGSQNGMRILTEQDALLLRAAARRRGLPPLHVIAAKLLQGVTRPSADVYPAICTATDVHRCPLGGRTRGVLGCATSREEPEGTQGTR